MPDNLLSDFVLRNADKHATVAPASVFTGDICHLGSVAHSAVTDGIDVWVRERGGCGWGRQCGGCRLVSLPGSASERSVCYCQFTWRATIGTMLPFCLVIAAGWITYNRKKKKKTKR